MKKISFLLALLPLFTISQKSGIQLSYMDKNVLPQNDFYNYCNGNWMKTFKMSETDSRYGSFNEINDNNLKNIYLIYENLLQDAAIKNGTNRQKLRDFYATAMDSLKANSLGVKPVLPTLKKLDLVKSKNELIAEWHKLDVVGVRMFFNCAVEADLKNSKVNRLYMNQGGYALPDKDFYYAERFAPITSAYKKYISKVFTLTGVSEDKANKIAEEVFLFEKKMLEHGKTAPEMRDIEKLYNPVSLAELMKFSPSLSIKNYFKSIGVKPPDTLILSNIDYFRNLDKLVASTDLSVLKNYAKWQLLNEAASYLSTDFSSAKFDFYGTVLSGIKTQKARWQRVHNTINTHLGDLISEEYVNKHFPQSAKDKLNVMIDNLVLAYRERIDSRDWMDEQTKKQAHRKLDLLIRKIGFPDKWKDYSGLKFDNSSYWANVCKAAEYSSKLNLGELYKPVDRYKWQMTPVTVNAYYNPTTNEITFPAAILQPPFYDPEADDAANYGTMGSIIGHELTHGFDDMGSQFDADGNMLNWWSQKDLEKFKQKKQGIINQFNTYVAIDTLRVNGEMTQGENIADLGGLTMSYYAYKKSLKGNKSPVIDGFTGEQRFFIAWCQGWKTICRDEELKRLLTVDFHSPGYFRAWAPLSNMKEFYEAFDVKPGHKLYTEPGKRVEIW